MKKLQSSAAAKACAILLLLISAFGAAMFGVRAVLAFQYVTRESWQDSTGYYDALDRRRQELKKGIDLSYQVDGMTWQIETGTAGPLVYADLEAFQEQAAQVEERFSRNNTWFRFRVMSADGAEVLGTNLKEGETLSKVVREVQYYSFEPQVLVESRGPYDDGDGGTSSGTDGEKWAGAAQGGDAPGDSVLEWLGLLGLPARLVLEYGVPEEVSLSVQDEFYHIWRTWELERTAFHEYLTGFVCMGALALAALIWVLWTSGHKSGEDGIVLTWQEKVFFDVYAAVLAAAGVFLLAAAIWAVEQVYWAHNNVWNLMSEDFEFYAGLGVMGAAGLLTGTAAAGTLLLRTLTVRVKAGVLAKTTLLCRVAAWMARTIHDFVRFLPFTWKVVLGFGVYVVLTFWLTMRGRYDGFLIMIDFFLQLVLQLFLAWWAYGYYRLRRGTKTIAGGDLEYQIDTKRMPYDLRLQAEDLNNISVGLAGAVDEKMKSERFKAELITNVSHDLKTPLTSIINYVNLLKSTGQSDPKAVEYIEVLDRKSQRLKKLTEDLVEASKASTGALSVVREKIGMGQLIDQAMGEWEEKLTDRKLTLVTTLPEGETWVYADGRHLWRVLDNLLSNCAKYAMEGTRVYLDLERGKGQVVLLVKNISREPLNVPAERLMERFVRGEESRSTEGSGLGLSIARSLTELQGGSFDLAVDGDLFKAIVTLPQAT